MLNDKRDTDCLTFAVSFPFEYFRSLEKFAGVTDADLKEAIEAMNQQGVDFFDEGELHNLIEDALLTYKTQAMHASGK